MSDQLLFILDLLAPAKPLRNGIDRIIEANLGALIFLAKNPDEYIENGIIQLGFSIDSDFSPEKIYELAKMDGAIVLSEDASKILFANVQINPDRQIPSSETGMRHRTAEKVSVQTGDLAIAVSKRRNAVSVFYKKTRNELLPESVLFARLNQELTTAQRYKQNFIELIEYLNVEESRGTATLYDVSETISKGLLTIKITEKTDRYLRELGPIAGSARLEYEEILRTVPKILGSIIMDYNIESPNFQKSEDAIRIFDNVKFNDIVNLFAVSRTLGYEVASDDEMEEKTLIPRAYRILYTTKLPSNSIKNIIETFENLENLMNASYDDLTNVQGIGKRRAEVILGVLNRKKKEAEVE